MCVYSNFNFKWKINCRLKKKKIQIRENDINVETLFFNECKLF